MLIHEDKVKNPTDQIITQKSLEDTKKEISDIKSVELPDKLIRWVKDYEQVGARNDFVWKLFYKVSKVIDYIDIEDRFSESLLEIRFLMAILVVLIDDCADQSRDEKLLDILSEIITHDELRDLVFPSVKKQYFLDFTVKVYRRIRALLKDAPQYHQLINIFLFDVRQMVGAMEYSSLINKNLFLLNKTEYWIHSPQTMQFAISGSVDMMFVSLLDYSEVGEARKILWLAQKMARIGNCLNTWERELKNNDFTSGVFAYAIDSRIMTYQDLDKKNFRTVIKKITDSKIADTMLSEWEDCRQQIISSDIKIISTKKLLNYLELLLTMEKISKDYK